MYHGTLEARPLGAKRTTRHYTLVWDDSAPRTMPRGEGRSIRYRSLREKMLRKMKKLAEGGTLTSKDKLTLVNY